MRKEKPAADAPHGKGAVDAGRRRFFAWLWAVLGLAAVAEFCWVGASFLLARKDRNAKAQAARVVVAGAVEGFAPGTVTAVGTEGITVQTGQGRLLLTELQRPGGKRLPAAEFLRGFPVSIGERFTVEGG